MPAPLTTTILLVAAVVAVLSPVAAVIIAGVGLLNQALIEIAAYYSSKAPTNVG